MKNVLFIFLIGMGSITACSNDTEEFESAAKEICSCMKKTESDAEDASSASLSIGFCLLDVKVDLKSQEMKAEIKKQCPEFSDNYAEFVKELK